MLIGRIPIRILSLLSLLPIAAGASCGTNFCPRHQQETAPGWQARWSVERSAYRLSGAAGTYSIGMLDVRYGSDRWIAGFHVPYVSLRSPGGESHGLGNTMALAEYRWRPAADRALGAGMQWELPWGDDAHGLAQPHYMAVAYLSASARRGPLFLGGNAGVSLAFGGSHEGMGGMAGMDHAMSMPMPAPSPVHPHEDREAIYRVSAGMDLPGWRLRPSAFVNGQRVLPGERELGSADDYLSAGLEAPITFGRVEIVPQGEIPITAEHRFEWSLGLACGVRF